MANTPMKVLLIFAGVLVAGLGTAYLAGTFNFPPQTATESASAATQNSSGEQGAGNPSNEVKVTAVIPGAGEAAGSAMTEEPGAVPAGTDDSDGAKRPRSTDGSVSGNGTGNGGAQTDVVVPSFDVLRVEPDGSMVVAGKAAPNAEVEVLSGSSVLATAATGDFGDFAAVLEKPLKPGEHNIVLRGTSPDNVATSVETAVVSIPSSEEGQVVALVQEPGKPSRLITVPEPETPAGSKDSKDQQEIAAKPDAKASDGSESVTAAPEADDQTDEAVAQSGGAAGNSNQSGSEKARASASGKERDTETSTETGKNVAAASGPGQGDPAKNEKAKNSPFIEAVEIDGRQVFVAGKAEPGRRVRVYLNDILLGQTDVVPEGSFLIEAERDLPTGDYIIRVDVLDDDGASVIARAAVPFERPAGERFAAVAREAADPQSGIPDAESAPRKTENDDAASSFTSSEEKSLKTGRLPSSRPGTTIEDTNDAGVSSRKPQETDIAMGANNQAGGARKSIMPPLKPTDGTVIIRRGDTLWHISRRVYGRGVRYSTIYLANEDQIRDPDLIYPGQIFMLPDETEEGEAANFSAIEDQALLPKAPPVDADG